MKVTDTWGRTCFGLVTSPTTTNRKGKSTWMREGDVRIPAMVPYMSAGLNLLCGVEVIRFRVGPYRFSAF